MKIVPVKFKRGKKRAQVYYAPVGSIREYISEFGKEFVTRMLVHKFNSEFLKCTSVQEAQERIKYLKSGSRKEYGRSEIKKSMLLALKAGKIKEARKLFAQLTKNV